MFAARNSDRDGAAEAHGAAGDLLGEPAFLGSRLATDEKQSVTFLGFLADRFLGVAGLFDLQGNIDLMAWRVRLIRRLGCFAARSRGFGDDSRGAFSLLLGSRNPLRGGIVEVQDRGWNLAYSCQESDQPRSQLAAVTRINRHQE